MRDSNVEAVLVPWRGSVDAGNSGIMLGATGMYSVAKNFKATVAVFAIYDEGLFAVWIGDTERLVVQAGNQRVKLGSSDKTDWSRSTAGRRLSIIRSRKHVLTFLCASLEVLLTRSTKLIKGFLRPDEDWGLESDLPSFVHSRHDDINRMRFASFSLRQSMPAVMIVGFLRILATNDSRSGTHTMTKWL